MRSPFQNQEEIFSKIQLNLLKEKGLEIATKVAGLKFDELESESYPIPDVTNLVTNHTENLLDNNRQYKLNFLEDGHVIKMSARFAEKVNTTLNNPYVVNAGAAASTQQAKAQQAKYLEAAMIKVKKGEAAQLFVSTNGHWTTCSLLPVGDNKFVIIGMDSMSSCSTIANDIVPKLVNFSQKLGLEIEKDGGKNFFNMSVNGQQQDACYGFASACNGFSLQKTYNDLTQNDGQLVKDGKFDKDAFKTALLPNIVYRQDTIKIEGEPEFTGTVLYGNKKTDLSLPNFVKQFGGLGLQEIASEDAMRKHLGENKCTIKQEQLEYPVDKTKLKNVLQGKEPLASGAQPGDDNIEITYSGKRYAISKDELYQIKDVKFVKGLEKVLNGGPLDVLLSDDRKKAIFIKILKNKFDNNQNPYTKQFVEDREILKNIIHIDQEIEDKIKEVIEVAKGDQQPQVEIGTWDAILLWLYNIPLLGRLVELCGAEVVNCASMIDKLENICSSWQKYRDLSESVNTLIAQPAA